MPWSGRHDAARRPCRGSLRPRSSPRSTRAGRSHGLALSPGRPLPELPGPSLNDIQAALRAQRRDIRNPGVGDIFRAESTAWAGRMLGTPTPFAERWANFWTNHLTVSRRVRADRALAGPLPALRHPRACLRPLRGDAARRLPPSGDAFLSRPGQFRRPDSPAGRRGQRPERKPRPRVHGAAHGHPGRRLQPGGRDLAGAHPHRLVVAGRGEQFPRWTASCSGCGA
jgi:hypothetical protein